MTTGTAARAADAIRSTGALVAANLQSFTPEWRAAFRFTVSNLIKVAGEVRATYGEALVPLRNAARSIVPALSVSRAVEYEGLLIQKGFDPIRARVSANWAMAMGVEYAEDITNCRRQLGAIMHQITKSNGTVAVANRADDLLTILNNWPKVWIENGLRAAGQPLSFEAFQGVLRQAADRDPSACAQLREVAQKIFPHLPKARGKALSPETVTHAIILVLIDDFGGPSAYTYSDAEDGFVDEMSGAAARQFGRRFSPISARELAKKLLMAE